LFWVEVVLGAEEISGSLSATIAVSRVTENALGTDLEYSLRLIVRAPFTASRNPSRTNTGNLR